MMEWDWVNSGGNSDNCSLAFVITLPIAWNRERADRVMGLRTFPLVAMASCGFMLLAESAFSGAPDAQARALQGIITGIGFIGAGAILKQRWQRQRERDRRQHLERGSASARRSRSGATRSRSCSGWPITSSSVTSRS